MQEFLDGKTEILNYLLVYSLITPEKTSYRTKIYVDLAIPYAVSGSSSLRGFFFSSFIIFLIYEAAVLYLTWHYGFSFYLL